MAEIRPFCGVQYNQELVKDIAAVICPPYDIISPQEQRAFYQRSDYNIIRLEYGEELPGDTPANNKYTRAAATLQNWLRQGILKANTRPAIYLHEHHFTHKGKLKKRQGIIACVKLEEWDKKVIRPHEGTLGKAKSDRLNLLRACQANLSPIFALYDDPDQRVFSLLNSQVQARPAISITTESNGETHQVWAITEPEIIYQVADCLASQMLYIADGHHRYETALAYRQEMRATHPQGTGNEAFNFVMMTLVATSDPGLIILPAHRLVRGISAPTLEGLKSKLEAFFELKPFPVNKPSLPEHLDKLLTGIKTQANSETALGLLGLEPECFFALTLRSTAALQDMMPGHGSQSYKKLDVSVLHHIVLERLLDISTERGEKEANLTYTHDEVDALKKVTAQDYQLAFLLNPVRVEEIKILADAGDKLTGKATYFYPKPPTGLVINRMVGEL